MNTDTLFQVSTREEIKDKYVPNNIEGADLKFKLFIRLGAKQRQFTKVDFSYSIFDACYLRDCVFDSCNFTGCRFVSTNLTGAKFEGCTFDYATFDKTQIDDSVLDNSCPSHENLKRRFAKSLRVNFQQLGETQAANKAIKVELASTRVYLKKAWWGNESYYRKKYKSLARLRMFLQWFEFRMLDLIWGNGESLPRLFCSVLIFNFLIAIFDWKLTQANQSGDLIKSLVAAPSIFLGTQAVEYFPPLALALIVFVRLVFMAFFMSIVIKRFNRR